MITPARLNPIRTNFQRTIGLLAGLLAAVAVMADEPGNIGGHGPLLVAEPSFLRPPSCEPIPGTSNTVQAAALWDGNRLRMLEISEVRQLDDSTPEWRTEARRRADTWVAAMEPKFFRDPDGVVIGAVLDTQAPVAGAVLFSDQLLLRWEDTFGPEFFAAVPSRFRIYLFPKLATRIDEFAAAVLSDYRVSPHPVSPEVFEVSRGMVRAVGELDDR